MNGWEKAWEVTKITVGGALAIVGLLLALASAGGRGSADGQGRSIWTVGGGGKKPRSWSSGRHR